MISSPDSPSTDPQAPQAIDAAIVPGAILGDRYAVRCRIGRGGMGSVWRVHDQRTGEDVALKVLVPRAGADAIARFRREVTLARRIAHPNVCRMFDLGVANGMHVLTMELVEGTSLRARIAQGPLPWPTACRLIDNVLAGLAAVHAAGIVHRDIKPENILIAADGRAVIADFGLACALTARVATTPEVGTPQYMAPEQLSGEAVDSRSDVFAAGLLIHEILDGRSPFQGSTAALVASAILRDPPQALEGKQVPVGLRPRVARVVARALGRDPATRQADAGEVQSEWLGATAGTPATRFGARRVGAIGIALVGAATAIFGFTRQHRAATEPATTPARAPLGDSTADLVRQPPAVAPTPAQAVEVAIASTPSGADVVLSGNVLGRTPFRGALPYGERGIAIVIRHRGYVDRTIVVRPDKPIAQQVDLVEKARPRPLRRHGDIANSSDTIVESRERSVESSGAIVKSQGDRVRPSDAVTSQDDHANPSDAVVTSQDGHPNPSDDNVKSHDHTNPADDNAKSQDDSVNPFHPGRRAQDRSVNPFKR